MCLKCLEDGNGSRHHPPSDAPYIRKSHLPPIEHGTEHGFRQHIGRHEDPCDECYDVHWSGKEDQRREAARRTERRRAARAARGKTVVKSFRLPVSLLENLQGAADRQGIPLNTLAERVLKEYAELIG